MEEIENGFRIHHEWLSRVQVIDFQYEDGRLLVSADADKNGNTEVLLTEEETAFALAHFAEWYGQGE